MKQLNNIVYVSEPGLDQDAAIARAVALAQSSQARLTVIEVVPDIGAGIGMHPGGPVPVELTTVMVQERQEQLESMIAPYRKHANIQFEILVGKMFLEVIRAVLRNNFDLVIKPAENPDFIDRLFGSDDMHLLRKCPCPVWLMKPEEKSNYQCIVAAVDIDFDDSDSDEQVLNRQILELASSLALSDVAELHLVHVWDVPEAGFIRIWAKNADLAEMEFIEGERLRRQSTMQSLTRQLREWLGVEAYEYLSPRIHLLMGNARKEVPALSDSLNADLVVMGTVARTGIPGFIIGNTAEAILDQLQCSVLAIKPPGFATPVTLDR